jgi:hypothetical protein
MDDCTSPAEAPMSVSIPRAHGVPLRGIPVESSCEKRDYEQVQVELKKAGEFCLTLETQLAELAARHDYLLREKERLRKEFEQKEPIEYEPLIEDKEFDSHLPLLDVSEDVTKHVSPFSSDLNDEGIRCSQQIFLYSKPMSWLCSLR